MRYCKQCKTNVNDNEINCPLCGAHTDPIESNESIVSGTYPNEQIRSSKKKLISYIFWVVTVLVIIAFALVSGLSKNVAFFAIAITALAYIWLGILQYVFNNHTVRQIVGGVFGYVIVFTNLICAHFYCNGAVNALNVSLGIVSPILLAVLNVVYMMIVFISGKWYRYAFQTIMLAILEVLWLLMTILANFNVVASIVCAALGLATIAFSFVFGRDVMFTEFKKRFHI